MRGGAGGILQAAGGCLRRMPIKPAITARSRELSQLLMAGAFRTWSSLFTCSSMNHARSEREIAVFTVPCPRYPTRTLFVCGLSFKRGTRTSVQSSREARTASAIRTISA
jgi:hypothetical protein